VCHRILVIRDLCFEVNGEAKDSHEKLEQPFGHYESRNFPSFCCWSPARNLLALNRSPFTQSPQVRDSVGVRIVENVRPAWPRGKEWLVASQPAVVIGDIEGEEHGVLGRVEGALGLSDGSFAIGDRDARRIRIYDSAGRHLRRFGGSGGGPGEFSVLGLIGRLRGDSIGVWDTLDRRN